MRLFAMMFCLILAGCSTAGHVVTGDKDAWIDMEHGGLNGLYYCRANPTQNGDAAPVCYAPHVVEPQKCYNKQGKLGECSKQD